MIISSPIWVPLSLLELGDVSCSGMFMSSTPLSWIRSEVGSLIFSWTSQLALFVAFWVYCAISQPKGNESMYLHRSGPLLENGLDRPKSRYGRYGFPSFYSISISTVLPLKIFLFCSLGGGGRYFSVPRNHLRECHPRPEVPRRVLWECFWPPNF